MDHLYLLDMTTAKTSSGTRLVVLTLSLLINFCQRRMVNGAENQVGSTLQAPQWNRTAIAGSLLTMGQPWTNHSSTMKVHQPKTITNHSSTMNSWWSLYGTSMMGSIPEILAGDTLKSTNLKIAQVALQSGRLNGQPLLPSFEMCRIMLTPNW